MAQTLIEDCTYNLLTQDETQDIYQKRCVYFVKLTDSCLKAIEEHITYKAATKTKPVISFEGQNGVIKIPSKPGSASGDVTKNFSFSVSNLKSVETNPLQGILDCIKHSDRRSNELLSYGTLESRISIAATDDVYENTRNRMAQVDQERKDIRTKEIKLGNVKQGKKAKAKVITLDSYKIAAMKKKLNNHVTTSSIKGSGPTYQASPNSNRNSPATVGKSFTCRERVIHILALRPYKKPELISRLQREAMSQKDRNNLAMVLQQVSSMVENQFKLHSHLYAEIKADTWPFYSENERLAVKRNIAAYRKFDTSSPQLVSSTSKSPEEKSVGIKRTQVTDSKNAQKRQKTLESSKPDEPTSTETTIDYKHKKITLEKENKQIKRSYEDESPPTVASTCDTPEYQITYKPITTYEQRCQYKRDFQAEYSEYLELKKNVDAVTIKFMELDRSWKRQEKGSPEYLRLHDEILKAYKESQENEKFHEMKRRCQELHQKLSHIKKLVMEYDNDMLTT